MEYCFATEVCLKSLRNISPDLAGVSLVFKADIFTNVLTKHLRNSKQL